MGGDRWKARVMGGRPGLLKVVLLGAVEWIAVGLRNTALSVLLMQGWNAIIARPHQLTTAKPDPVIALDPARTPWTGMVMEIRVVDAIRCEVRDSSPPQIA
jgi:hypothetical protein